MLAHRTIRTTGFRGVAAAVAGVLMLHLVLGASFASATDCDSAQAPRGNAAMATVAPAGHQHMTSAASDGTEQQEPCPSCPSATCSMPASGPARCDAMQSCASVTAQLVTPALDEDAVRSPDVNVEQLVPPRARLTGPESPPPRA